MYFKISIAYQMTDEFLLTGQFGIGTLPLASPSITRRSLIIPLLNVHVNAMPVVVWRWGIQY